MLFRQGYGITSLFAVEIYKTYGDAIRPWAGAAGKEEAVNLDRSGWKDCNCICGMPPLTPVDRSLMSMGVQHADASRRLALEVELDHDGPL